MKFFTTSDISSLHSSDLISSHLQSNCVTSTSNLAHMKINRKQHHEQIDQITEQVSVNNDRNLQNYFINHNKDRNVCFIIKSAFEFNCFLNDEKI